MLRNVSYYEKPKNPRKEGTNTKFGFCSADKIFLLIFSSLVEREASFQTLERKRDGYIYTCRVCRRNKARALGILGTGVGANRPGRNLRANFEGGNSITTLLDLPQAPTPEALPRIAHIALFRSISNPKRAVAKPNLFVLPMSCTLNYARVPSRYESEAFLPLLPTTL